jgi:hypothetical protein
MPIGRGQKVKESKKNNSANIDARNMKFGQNVYLNSGKNSFVIKKFYETFK